MPIEQERHNQRQRSTPQKRVNNRDCSIRCQRKHDSSHDQFAHDEIDRHRASKIPLFAFKLKVTDGTIFMHLKHARKYFSSCTDRIAEKESTQQKIKEPTHIVVTSGISSTSLK